MPFKSQAQQRKFFADPKLKKHAKKWADHTPNIKDLPEKKAWAQAALTALSLAPMAYDMLGGGKKAAPPAAPTTTPPVQPVAPQANQKPAIGPTKTAGLADLVTQYGPKVYKGLEWAGCTI